MPEKYTWIKFYKEFANELLKYKNKRNELINIIKSIYQDTGINMAKVEADGSLMDIDPFTVFGLFNKQISKEKRDTLTSEFAKRMNLTTPPPSNYDGLPVLNNQNAAFFRFYPDRGENDIDDLWELFDYALNYSENQSKENEENFIKYFDLCVNKEYLKDIHLPFYGKHMLINSLACIACCSYLKIPTINIIESLKKYKDAGRRYNISFVKNNIIVDDYGHHPTEIKATISAIKQEFYDKNIIIVYHPDRPKRLVTFVKDFKVVFNSVDKVFILPFINENEEGRNAINLIVDNDKICEFSDSFYKKYENTVFLFTGSKEMGNIIKKLNIFL
jgi:hypothetical protein